MVIALPKGGRDQCGGDNIVAAGVAPLSPLPFLDRAQGAPTAVSMGHV